MPNPFNDRELVLRSMWKKLDENTYFYSQLTCQHDEFPARPGVVRIITRRSVKLTKIHAKLTLVETSGSADLGGGIPRRINDAVTIPFVAASSVGVHQYERERASEASENNQPVDAGVVWALPFGRCARASPLATPPPRTFF
jgi:hypothetical protein